MIYCYIFGAVSLILTLLFLIIRTTVGGAYGIATKSLASFSFIALAMIGMMQTGSSTYSIFVVLGLVCGLIGDILLDNKVVYKEHENIYLNSGMLSFGVGHIFYFVAASSVALALGVSGIALLISLGVSLILTLIIFLLSKPLKLNFGKFFYQTLAYTLILTFMSAYSIILACYNASYWTFAVGLASFFVSDLILSTQYFGGQQDNKLLIWLNHLTYYIGQIFIAVSLFLI